MSLFVVSRKSIVPPRPLPLLSCLLFLLGVFAWQPAPGASFATNMTPITVTGWNRDVVVEATASGPPFSSYAVTMNAGEGNAFYQTGLRTYPWGLPPSGGFVSMVGDNAWFQWQPYTGNNALI